MVEKALEELRQRYAELVPVDREAGEGDHVYVRTEEGAEFPIDLSMALPHVREALLGKRAGDVVLVPVLNEKGEKVREVRTEVLEVKALELPELNEEFAKTLEAESLEDLKAKVRESLKRQAEAQYQEARERAFLERLAEGLEADIPPSMLEAEERHLLEHLAEDLYRQGVGLEAYLKALEEKGELPKFKEELRQEALRRVKRSLAKERLAEELRPELTQEEWQAYLQAVARSYGLTLPELRREFGERGLERLKAAYLQDKAVRLALAQLPREAMVAQGGFSPWACRYNGRRYGDPVRHRADRPRGAGLRHLLPPPQRPHHLPGHPHRRPGGQHHRGPAPLPGRAEPQPGDPPLHQLPWGEVDAGLAIYDTMQFVRAPVSTIVIGMAASMRR